jgi:hypothetical protein
VLSFNFTHLDIDHSRGFGIVQTGPLHIHEAVKLFKADCTRTKYAPKTDTFVVSPANARRVLGAFLKKAKTQLLIYDPAVSDGEMLRILSERAKAGVEVKIIGKVTGKASLDSQNLSGMRLHTRTIIRDRQQAFVGSQSLRAGELDSRREVGLILQEPKIVKRLLETFESDWIETKPKSQPAPEDKDDKDDKDGKDNKAEAEPASAKEVAKAVGVFTKELQPLAATVKKAVRQAVLKAGDDVLHDKDIKDTMKQVVKDAVKEAVKDAVHDAQDAQDATPDKGAA